MSDDAVLALKRHLAPQLVKRLDGWNQTDAAALVGTDQPRISDLRRGRLANGRIVHSAPEELLPAITTWDSNPGIR